MVFVSDEIYHGLAFGRNSLGASVFRPRDRRQLVLEILLHDRMAHRFGCSAASSRAAGGARRTEPLHFRAELSQVGAEAVFEATEELEAVKLGYERSRALLMDALPQMGFGDIAPIDGAFYAYATIPARSRNPRLRKHLLGKRRSCGHDGARFRPRTRSPDDAHVLRRGPAENAEAVRRLRAVLQFGA